MSRKNNKPSKYKLVLVLLKKVGLPPPRGYRSYLNQSELAHVIAYIECNKNGGCLHGDETCGTSKGI